MRGRGPKYNGQLSDGWALAGPWAALGVGLIHARTLSLSLFLSLSLSLSLGGSRGGTDPCQDC